MTALATVEPLVDAPADRLAQLEAVVERASRDALAAFVEVGLALVTIRDERLFAATHDSFKSYLEDRWGFGQQWAYLQMYAGQVAQAISARGLAMHEGIAVDALRPLFPLLNREGPDAAAEAWEAVTARYGTRYRAPSRSEVRAVLVGHGLVTTAPERARAPRLGPIGDGLFTAAERLDTLRARLGERSLPPDARARAAELATVARRLATNLEALADGSVAAARLAAAESHEDLCVGHGLRRRPDGTCDLCGRPDVESR